MTKQKKQTKAGQGEKKGTGHGTGSGGGRGSGPGKPERYVQPSILMALRGASSYGYELIRSIEDFGFMGGNVPPGMIYRHLRQMEEEGLLVSEWQTEESGPAKRMYRITDDGLDVLEAWVGYMERQAERLAAFVRTFHHGPDQG